MTTSGTKALADAPDPALVKAVRSGLKAQPRTLPAWLFYDARGSELFEQITRLPEYYLTRAEREILEHHAHAIAALAGAPDGAPLNIVELGAGSAVKTQVLLSAVVARQGSVDYLPVDVSGSALKQAAARLAREAPDVRVRPFVGTHLAALPAIRALGPRRLALFLGSSIGNYSDHEAVSLLSALAEALAPGDALLLGTDRMKDPALLVSAYDDAAGVTAAFNQNLLTRLNRELGANFKLANFRHEARWNETESRIEMHLVARTDHVVRIPTVGELSFAEGSSIHTESSVKYDLLRVERLLVASGFRRVHTFSDGAGRFDLHLARV